MDAIETTFTDEPLDISILDGPPQVVDDAYKVQEELPRPIDYATPVKKQPNANNMYAWWFAVRVGRKLLFAGGLGLFASGLGETIEGRFSDAPTVMGLGAAMVGLAIPLSRRGTK